MLSKAVANLIFPLALCASILSAAAFETNTFGRILIVEHPDATRSFTPDPDPVRKMLREGLLQFTGAGNLKQAWLQLVSTQDTIGIKVHSAPGPMSGTRPAVVSTLVESLLAAGIQPQKIVIWDRRAVDLRFADYYALAEKYRIQVASAQEEEYDTNTFYPSSILGRLVFGDLEFGKKGEGVGRNSYVTRLLTRRITKIINVTPLLNHNQAGVSGVLFGLAMASVDNTLRFEEADRLATAIPEIYALPEIADRVVLNIVDALICQYRGEELTRFNYATPLNQLWFSRDPVALDSLAIQELDRQRPDQKARKSTLQIYSNAELMDLGIANTNRLRIERLDLK
jgi:hypothetical protein